MPKQSDISSVLVIGAGPIVIGQACEFDYSGTQACKALKEEGLRVILINSNPATIMTDPEVADATYIEPLDIEVIERIISKEKPDVLLSTVGGQTALNCSLELARQGILEKYNVRMIGANLEAIEKAEDRQFFNEAMEEIGLDVPKNVMIHSLEEALEALKKIGLPAVIRPSFTLGGSGGGIAETVEEFKQTVQHGLDMSPINQVLIDESIVGWKEYEMEVIRDCKDNAIVVCSIENIDPMGIHTGDSITVAPALTLTDKEYQYMRDASIAVLRKIGVETGGSNVQFAINPEDGRLVVIEMNPRVSRSSALASKATGFPIAKVAAKLAIGYTLDEIQNDITKVTPASFEPTIDYVVVKIPRFNFEKFSDTSPLLSISMRSVGEIMSIGRSFSESLQKGFNSLEIGMTGLNSLIIEGLIEAKSQSEKQQILRDVLKTPKPDRLIHTAEAMRHGLEVEEICKITGIDSWFLREIEKIVSIEKSLIKKGLPENKIGLIKLKKLGFSDERLAELTQTSSDKVRELRHKQNIRPVFKSVDTCAAEFDSSTSYLYSCYEGDGISEPECEANPSDKKKIVILGSGPNRIGQGIEFDYTCIHAAQGLSDIGYESIMVNCNPETVSTDYDSSHRLYFEPLCLEYVLEILHVEQKKGTLVGVIVNFGGQTPLKLAHDLKNAGICILGTSPDSIDLSEDRERFQQLLISLRIKQPKNTICRKVDEIAAAIKNTVGYPVVVRPSHVLGGRAMSILKSDKDLEKYLFINRFALVDGPILIDTFLDMATEVDVDAICDGEQVYIAGIMEHIERAGIHSGDSACVLPPFSLSKKILEDIKSSTEILAKAIDVIGLVNIQFAIQNEELYVLEVNPRASRTTPFVAKATGVPVARIAAQIMVGKKIRDYKLPLKNPDYYAVKEVVLPFARFPFADTLLGPEMKSTGEVMGWDKNLDVAFAKAQLSAMNPIAQKGTALVIYDKKHRKNVSMVAKSLIDMDFKVVLADKVVWEEMKDFSNICLLDDLLESEKVSLVDFMQSGKIDLAVCVNSSTEFKGLRRLFILGRVPYFSTHQSVLRMLKALPQSQAKSFSVNSIQSIQRIH